MQCAVGSAGLARPLKMPSEKAGSSSCVRVGHQRATNAGANVAAQWTHFDWTHLSVIAGLTRANCLFRPHEGSNKKGEIVEFRLMQASLL